MTGTHKSHPKNIVTAGSQIKDAGKALIMVHGRGGSAKDILSLGDHLHVTRFALLAPQAGNHSWYPYSFMSPPSQNEPWLSDALTLLKELMEEIIEQGIQEENIYFLGFSQGACLVMEFVARNAEKLGGVVAFSGGLIGDKIYPENYKGDFKGTPVFIGSSNPDPHIPVNRVHASTRILKDMNADVTEKVYEDMGHTISENEIELANKLIFTS